MKRPLPDPITKIITVLPNITHLRYTVSVLNSLPFAGGFLSDVCLRYNDESLTGRSELPQRYRNELLVSFLQLQATGSNW